MEPRLDAGERARVRAARDTARLALRSTLERRKPDAALAAVAGMPGADDAIALFEAPDEAIWSARLASGHFTV
jgi:hypothetical protein